MKPSFYILSLLALIAWIEPGEAAPRNLVKCIISGGQRCGADDVEDGMKEEMRRPERFTDFKEGRVKQPALDVYVDRTEQKIYIWELNGERVEAPVSTGGGFKTPYQRAPVCAETPRVVDRFIPAIYEKGVAFNVAPFNRTMFDVWESRAYRDASGDNIPMRKAIKIDNDGNFFHVVPSGCAIHMDPNDPNSACKASYENMLGMAVSGGCIRLGEATAAKLFRLALKHGGFHLTIDGPAPQRGGYPAPYNHVCKRDANGEAYKEKAAKIAKQELQPDVASAPRKMDKNKQTLLGMFRNWQAKRAQPKETTEVRRPRVDVRDAKKIDKNDVPPAPKPVQKPKPQIVKQEPVQKPKAPKPAVQERPQVSAAPDDGFADDELLGDFE
ncbi:MAG TPA: L,D-transpeptidase family protein, partial [Bdellovibrionales bacterium]|nr:L,D-transpeptidase family protein [Bdellovibrionales bacterium]